MSKTGLLRAENRDAMSSRANKRLRASGYLPGSISARGEEPISIMIKMDVFQKALAKYGRSNVFKLELDNKEVINAMVKELQMEANNCNFINVGFQKVSLSEEIKANIGIILDGTENLISKRLRYSQQVDTLAVKGLPQDIPNAINVDVSQIEAGENLLLSEIKLPKGITLDMDDMEQVVFSVAHPRVQAEDTDSDASDEETDTATNEE